MTRLHLSIDSNLGDVSLIAVAVNNICVHLGLGVVQASEVELCIVEAVTNVIKHSYHGKSGRTVEVAIASLPNQLQFEISDNGTPMPVEKVKRLIHGVNATDLSPSNTELLPEGGRGLQIIFELMDEVGYVQREGRNCLALTKYIGSPCSA